MTKAAHYFEELFAQLGLPSDSNEIVHFLTIHAAMVDGFRLPDAPYWTASQSAFLRESLLQDSDWSGIVDQLSKALCSPPLLKPYPHPIQRISADQSEAIRVKEDPAQSWELERQQDA